MTTATALTLLGFGLGALVVARSSARSSGRSSRSRSIREQAIAAQRESARAAQVARDLAERALAEEPS